MSTILERARATLRTEIAGLEELEARLGPELEQAVARLHACAGKVVVAGLGKSGLIGQKIASTLSSTGTPALFLHAADSAHGDLGIIMKQDAVIALSYSGETAEVVQMSGHLQAIGAPLIALTGNPDSALARSADVHLNVAVSREACPLNLAPTASSTAMLALGDALAMCLLEKRNFREEDFAVFHPGGSLGKKLTVLVQDVMMSGEHLPLAPETLPMREAMLTLSRKNLGIVVAQDTDGRASGVFTTGDLMRLVEQQQGFLNAPLAHFMSAHPKTIAPDELAAKALHLMETHSITCLVVADPENRPVGIAQIYHILRAGVY
ncbi:MAG: KpsF/GutQ family sugar-phosphate isomerase [SAR324 cluster bacterium]|nr:KpsF/GutQ family sugar-phosphate isomerase [SAR324 cluster bacterium]